ncbi:MAG: CPBP family intramembrane glutamic endopeptidase [Acidobacteriota bacterium]
MRRDERYPGFWQAIGVLFAIFLVTVSLFLVLRGALHRPDDDPFVATAATAAAVLLVLPIARRRTGLPWSRVFPLRPFRAALLPGMVAAIVGLGILGSEVDNWLQTVAPPPKRLTEMFEKLLYNQPLWFALLLGAVIVPLYEECLFRGLILRGLLTRYRPAVAIVTTALLFALYHGNLWQFASAFFGGLLLGWLVAGTGSLLAGIIGHGLNNALGPLVARSGIRIPGFTTPGTHQPLWVDAVGLVLLTGGIAWLRRAPELAHIRVATAVEPEPLARDEMEPARD